jgi:hypothetical protein
MPDRARMRQGVIPGFLGVLDFYKCLAAICAAVEAGTMRDMIFTTPFAHHQMIQRQAVMRPAAIAAAARDFTFWQRTHAVYSSDFI